LLVAEALLGRDASVCARNAATAHANNSNTTKPLGMRITYLSHDFGPEVLTGFRNAVYIRIERAFAVARQET
jgi:hypothetical protein